MAQALVAARRVRVVVAVALQMEGGEVGHEVVGVPRMVRLRRLVAGGVAGIAPAQQAVVLDVVGRGELPPRHRVVDQQERDHHRTEGRDQPALQQRGDRIRLQHRVLHRPGRVPQRSQPPGLERPRAAHAAWQFAQREAVDRLAHARAGVVVGRGDPAVVTAAMLDREVAVGRHRERQPRQPLLERVVLVAEFMRGVQPQARIGAGRVGQDQQRPPRQVLRAGPPRAGDQRDEVQRHRGPRQPAVVAVGVELRHDGLGRVAVVFADQRIEHGHQAVADHERQRQRDLPAGDVMRPEAEQRHQRVDDRERPGPALAVPVFDSFTDRADRNVDLGHRSPPNGPRGR